MENINTAWNFLEEQLPKGKHFFFQTSQAVPFGWFPFKGNERSQNRFNMPHFMPMDSNCIDMEIMSTLGITKNAWAFMYLPRSPNGTVLSLKSPFVIMMDWDTDTQTGPILLPQLLTWEVINSHISGSLELDLSVIWRNSRWFSSLSSLCLSGCITEYEKNPIVKAIERVYGLTSQSEESSFTKNVVHAVQTIEECFDRYRWIITF